MDKTNTKANKNSKTSISRSSIVNKRTQDGTIQASSNMSGSQNNLKPKPSKEDDYANNVKFQLIKGNKTSPKKSLRDFSTGVRRNGQNSLTASQDQGITNQM